MAGKGVELIQAKDVIPAGAHGVPNPVPDLDIRLVQVMLSGTVLVDYEITSFDSNGDFQRSVVRVEFPDEVRSMLVSTTWSRGTTILEAVGKLGAAYLDRLARAGVLRTNDGCPTGSLARHPLTFHIPLADLRASLAAVCASGV